ncbi:hypothetical protein BABINDRAFT_161852 [Babjeviella inositovora NRRL Y-12698]|uniref:Uncharacterized protein n=1 Tax=Babjeviella inositovora NRRL Y-12698 TaxID=984486 RepID=A0A1E3QPR3_9ASCO|nr:uncharacterized protein BABINDRAFT_161852 [Babjeviella inositovora NRRL Y-12698]ODQ79454.1 hypothetical protein BABINDRAFT_161852 [Babjeviella inositovora NRRL Y-12698]
MSVQELTQEEMDCILYDARVGDLESLTEIFTELAGSVLLTIKDEFSLSTPIHMASANGHVEVVKYLLSKLTKEESKAFINLQNDSGNTALHWAALNGHLPVVEVLCEYDADAFIKNSSGHDAIFEAENNNKEEIENWFLKKYAIEDDYFGKLDEDAPETVKFQPGMEIEQAQKEGVAAEKELEEQTQNLAI